MYSKIISLFTLLLFLSCINNKKLTLVTELPKQLSENSGIVTLNPKSVWFIEDSGNTNKVYQTNLKGGIIISIEIKNAKNRDWEDLTKDEKGNIYIGDIGNNANKRKDLIIYKISNLEHTKEKKKVEVEEIKFYYPEQTKFPPKKKNLYFDAESLFYFKNALYIITKNRANPFNGEALVYKVPAIKGSHEAKLVDVFTICDDWNTCQITSADISPDGSKLVLLSYGNLFIISDFKGDKFSKGSIETIDLKLTTQLESVCFLDQNTLLISDEKKGPTGKNLYSFMLN